MADAVEPATDRSSCLRLTDLPFPGESLRLRHLLRRHLFLNNGSIASGLFVRFSGGVCRGQVDPLVCLDVILRNPLAGEVHDAQTVLRVGIALVGGLAVPDHRLFVILHNPSAFMVHDPQIELGPGLALVGGLAVPDHRLFVILHNPSAVAVHEAQTDLRFGVALVGSCPERSDVVRVGVRVTVEGSHKEAYGVASSCPTAGMAAWARHYIDSYWFIVDDGTRRIVRSPPTYRGNNFLDSRQFGIARAAPARCSTVEPRETRFSYMGHTCCLLRLAMQETQCSCVAVTSTDATTLQPVGAHSLDHMPCAHQLFPGASSSGRGQR